MKKTLLSVLAGLAVIGSASAVPTPEDRQNLCDLLIEKGTHVWVEKTKACIPINPCAKDVSDDIRKAYCLTELAETFNFRNGDDVYDFAKRYASATKVYFDYGSYITANSEQNIGNAFPEKKYVNAERATYLVKTADHGYFAFDFTFREEPRPLVNRKPVCLVFGYETGAASCEGVESEQKCNDMQDYWNLLEHKAPEKAIYEPKLKSCVLV